MRVLASALFGDLDTTTQVPSFLQYRVAPRYKIFEIHLHMLQLTRYIFLDLEPVDQTHQALPLPLQNHRATQALPTAPRMEHDLDRTPKVL